MIRLTRRVGPALLALTLIACTEPAPPAAPVAQSQQPVVYGEDTRQDVYAHPDEALRDLARRAIVSEVGLDRIDRTDPADFVMSGRTLGESRNLCEGERFADQVRVSSCSGTLVGPQTVLTAGHCIDADECPERAYVFDRFYRAEGVLETVTAEDVYPCRRVLVRSNTREDYAFVELDRPVTGDRAPVPIRVVEPLDAGTPLTMIGFPNGIPAKIDSGGRVILPGEAPWVRLEATVDAFGGNSGSGIFDAEGALVALLAGGRTDYVDEGECRVVNRLPEDVDDAESLVYVGRALDALCAAEPFHWLCEPAFEGGTWCEACDDAADCRAGWICDGTCRPPCAGADCRSDHACVDGTCTPQVLFECRSNAIWALPGCEPVRRAEDCGPDARCADGACLPLNAGDRCDTAIEIAAEDAVIEGRTDAGFTNGYEGDCGGERAEVVYTFTLDAPAQLTAGATGFDTLLHLRRDCDAEIACNDDRERGDEHARIEADLEPGTYHLFMDGYDEDGAYTLTLDFTHAGACAGCDLGTRRCTADGVSACVLGEDDCPGWTDPIPCRAGERCEAGACVDAPEGDTCAEPFPLAAEDAVIRIDPSDHAAHLTGACGGTGPDRIYRIDLDTPTRLRAFLAGDAPVLYVRAACAEGPEIGCAVGAEGPALLDVALPAGTTHLVADTNADGAGPYQLTLDFECIDCLDLGPPVEDAGPPDMQVDALIPDAAPPDAAVVDMQRPDAARPDAAAPGDAAPTPDRGTDGGPPPAAAHGSDGCSAAPTPRPPSMLLLVLLGVLRRRP